MQQDLLQQPDSVKAFRMLWSIWKYPTLPLHAVLFIFYKNQKNFFKPYHS